MFDFYATVFQSTSVSGFALYLCVLVSCLSLVLHRRRDVRCGGIVIMHFILALWIAVSVMCVGFLLGMQVHATALRSPALVGGRNQFEQPRPGMKSPGGGDGHDGVRSSHTIARGESNPPPPEPLLLAVDNIMTLCGVRLSSAMRDVVRNRVAELAEMQFARRDHQEAATYLVCIESNFNPRNRSPSGALGLTQIIPAYAPEFARLAGLGTVHRDDLLDVDISLRLGFALFSSLITKYEGSVTRALIAYNSGPSSRQSRAAARGEPIDGEPAQYVAAFEAIRAAHRGYTPGVQSVPGPVN